MTAETAAPWALDPYACAVVDVLAGDFPDLSDPIVASIVRKHVYLYARTDRTMRTPAHLEVILDDPFTAKWRLVSRGGRVQVACWRPNPSEADRERADRLNAALDAFLDAPEGER